jgi:hypothetical protein
VSDHPEDEPKALVTVTLELPIGLLAAYDGLVEDRLYPDRASALLHGLVESWRHNEGSFHTVRLDLRRERDQDETVSEAASGEEDSKDSGS